MSRQKEENTRRDFRTQLTSRINILIELVFVKPGHPFSNIKQNIQLDRDWLHALETLFKSSVDFISEMSGMGSKAGLQEPSYSFIGSRICLHPYFFFQLIVISDGPLDSY